MRTWVSQRIKPYVTKCARVLFPTCALLSKVHYAPKWWFEIIGVPTPLESSARFAMTGSEHPTDYTLAYLIG